MTNILPPRADVAFSPSFYTRYRGHCSPAPPTYSARLNWRYLTGHPACPEIFLIQDTPPISPLTNICNHHCLLCDVKKARRPNRRATPNIFNSIPIDFKLEKRWLIKNHLGALEGKVGMLEGCFSNFSLLASLFISSWRHVDISQYQMPSVLQHCDPHQRWPGASVAR